jgi:uncharacterized YigZ family protein
MDSYLTISERVIADYRIKGSKFLSFAQAVSSKYEFEQFIGDIRIHHPKANHYCYAYRLFSDKEIRNHDDGEPSSTAGKPISKHLENNELYNAAVVVVRYFGGTKLGIRGLIDAYGHSALICIQNANIVRKNIYVKLEIQYEYSVTAFVERFMAQNTIEVLDSKYDSQITQIIGISPSKFNEMLEKLKSEIKQEFGSQSQTPYPVKIKPS